MKLSRLSAPPASGKQRAVSAVLLADGGIVVPGRALAAADNWRAVGCTVQNGERVCFVQAQIRGEAWSALVPEAVLAATSAQSPIRLRRQAPTRHRATLLGEMFY